MLNSGWARGDVTLEVDKMISDAGGGQDVLYQVFIHPGVTFEPLSTDPDHLRLLQDTNLQLKLHGHLSKV